MQTDQFLLVGDAIAELDRCVDADSIMRMLGRRIERLGFEKFAYLLARPARLNQKNYISSTYAQNWCDRYKSERYINIDPIVKQIATRRTPFLWQPLLQAVQPTGTQRKMLAEAAEVGVLVGGTIPLQGASDDVAVLSVTSAESPDSFRKLWDEHHYALHLMACYAHERVLPLIADDHSVEPFSLSPRETECLVWTSRGKSAWAIGEILSISQRTVEDHLRMACHKLGVQSKIQAVVVAIMNRLIIP